MPLPRKESSMLKLFRSVLIVTLILWCGRIPAGAQQATGTLRGQLKDESGAVIPGATVVAAGAGVRKTAGTQADGSYVLAGLPPGQYTVSVNYTGFSPYQNRAVVINAGKTTQLAIALTLATGKQEVTVVSEPPPTVSVEPENNAGALVLRKEDLESLPDDPDDLANDLQALAGPSAGPSGGQIYIDGFTGNGRLPPKESIREVRINQNPFSAEYDKLGFGRIEILTKPGSDKFRGMAFFNFSDAAFNSRNPFAPDKPSFQSRYYGGNVSGPLSKRASFFLDMDERDLDANAVINATILDSNLNPVPFSQALVTPNRRTEISPRLDYQLSTNNTLVARYRYSHVGEEDQGIGQFSLASRAYSVHDTQQLTETAVLSPKAINETRFQYQHLEVSDIGDNTIPSINVLDSFTGGGAQIGHSVNTQNYFEIQNYTSLTLHTHTVRFGVRSRTENQSDISPQNFGGTFTFAGGTGITSIDRYRLTLLGQQQGLSMDQIRALGGGPTQFTLNAGNPLAALSQTDIGAFVQDDWRMRPGLTLSLGLRYETQTNIHDWRDIAPRVGFAWAPGAGRGGRQQKTVIRGGWGIFYDRFAENLVLQTMRFNGVAEQQYVITDPNFYPSIPPISSLTAGLVPQSIWRVDGHLRAPYTMQSAIGIERQLPFNTTIATTFTYSRAMHLLRARDINAPLPGTFNPAIPGSGVRPYGDIGNLFQYESTGILNQNQWITNVNSRLNRNISLFAFYVLGYAHSNTDGASTYPADPYNMADEYGRSALDVRHRFVLGGSIAGPWALRLSPFLIAHSGAPFNIITGADPFGDATFAARPAFATDLSRPSVVITPLGAFDLKPTGGEQIIPRNYGQGPAYFSLNLRLSKTFGFGAKDERGAPAPGGGFGGGRGGGRGPGGGGMRMGGGMRGGFGDSLTNHRYNLTFSVSARNLLNNVNFGMPSGNLTSPFFGRSNSIAGGFGPAAIANNRRLELQLRFNF